MRQANLSIVIPTYERPETLRATINSYLSGGVLPKEIVVVDQSECQLDSASLGGTRGCTVRVIPVSTPSLTHARNVGAQHATEDVILFSDDDILVNDESIALLDEAMSDASVALVAGVDLPGNGVHSSVPEPSPMRNVAGFCLGMKKPWRKDGYVIKSNMRGRYPSVVSETVPTEWAMGYFFCVRRSCMKRWNCWFDENLKRYAYAEDLDFSFRYCMAARNEGLKTLLVPDIYVNHLGSKEWRTPTDEATRYFIANRRYLAKKLFPERRWYLWAMNIFDTLFSLAQLPKDKSYAICLLRHIWVGKSR